MFAATVSVLLALALLYAPGAAVAAVLRQRPLTVLAVAPALTFAVVSVGSMALTAADIRWTPWAVGAWSVLAVLAAALVSVLLALGERRVRESRDRGRRGRPGPEGQGEGDDEEPGYRSSRGAGALGWAVAALAALAGAVQVMISSGLLTRPPQYWDTIFHAVAIRYIADTGKASPFSLAGASQPTNPDFYYPDVYHAIGAVLLQVPGQGLPEVLSALSAATVVVFVLGTAAVVSRLGGGPVAVAVAAAAASASWAFPYSRLNWGPVLPYALGVAAITGAVVLGLVALRGRRQSVRAAVPLGAVMAGLLAVHPSVGAGAAIILGCLLLVGSSAGSRLAALVTLALGAVVAAALFLPQFSFESGSAVAGFRWPKDIPLVRVIREYLEVTLALPASVAWWLLLLAGVVVAVRSRLRPALGLLLAAVLFSAVFSMAYAVAADWAHLFTAVWWDDGGRLHALMMVAATPLVGLGAGGLAGRLADARRPRSGRSVGTAAAFVVLGLGLLAAGHVTAHRELTAEVFADGPAVTEDEAAMYAELAELYDGGTVLGDPFDGSGWLYAIHGVPVLLPSPLADDPATQVGPDRMLVYSSINRYGYEPAVTRAVRALDVRWVLVGSGVVGGPGRPPGFEGMGHNPHLELVAANEGARLYRVLPVPDHGPLPAPPGVPAGVPPLAKGVESLAVVGGPDRPGEP